MLQVWAHGGLFLFVKLPLFSPLPPKNISLRVFIRGETSNLMGVFPQCMISLLECGLHVTRHKILVCFLYKLADIMVPRIAHQYL